MEELSMSDHRYVVRGHAQEGKVGVTETPNSIAVSQRETTQGRRRHTLTHLEPVPLTPEDVQLLPVAHRYSA